MTGGTDSGGGSGCCGEPSIFDAPNFCKIEATKRAEEELACCCHQYSDDSDNNDDSDDERA